MIFIFVLLVNDDWNSYMFDYVRASSDGTILFFIAVTVLGNIILLNLFLAILLKDFEEAHNVVSTKRKNGWLRYIKAKTLRILRDCSKKRAKKYMKKEKFSSSDFNQNISINISH